MEFARIGTLRREVSAMMSANEHRGLMLCLCVSNDPLEGRRSCHYVSCPRVVAAHYECPFSFQIRTVIVHAKGELPLPDSTWPITLAKGSTHVTRMESGTASCNRVVSSTQIRTFVCGQLNAFSHLKCRLEETASEKTITNDYPYVDRRLRQWQCPT